MADEHFHPIEESGIRVESYDPRWSEAFRVESARVAKALGPFAKGIEHIGSTSVPDCSARPIVDILVGTGNDPRPTLGLIAALWKLGYDFLGRDRRRGDRWMFRKRDPAAFNLSTVSLDSALWKDNLAFRDYLRSHSDEAERYSDIKRKGAEAHADSLLAYQDHKRAYVEELLIRARHWASSN